MSLEQQLPNKPNFGLVVGLFCAALIVIFILAIVFLRFDGGQILVRHHTPNPNARITRPAHRAAIDA